MNSMNKNKNAVESIYYRADEIKGRISDLKNRNFEITKSEETNKKE